MGMLDHATPKGGAATAWRTVAPAETLSRVAPFFPEVGITRVANVTGLDRIGLPVWQACRPLSRGLSVAQGKGVDDDSARASAVMEGIEQHHAEFTTLATRLESFAVLSAGAAVASPDRLPRSPTSIFTPERVLPWVEATNVADGTPVWIPFEIVHANTVLPRVPGSGAFPCNTNGLASGNSPAEALLHGLCELIERDAHALWSIGGPATAAATRVDLDTVPASAVVVVGAILTRYDRARIDVALWDMTSDVDLATYRCIITDRDTDLIYNPVPASYGAGTHPDPVIAMARALTEAAQSRLAAIAGTRDDLTRAHYDALGGAAAVAEHRADATDTHRPVDASARASRATDTIEGDLRVALDRLAGAGLDQVLYVDLSRPGWPVSVVRVVVPGLEGVSSSSAYQPGARAVRHHQRLLAESSGVGT